MVSQPSCLTVGDGAISMFPGSIEIQRRSVLEVDMILLPRACSAVYSLYARRGLTAFDLHVHTTRGGGPFVEAVLLRESEWVDCGGGVVDVGVGVG